MKVILHRANGNEYGQIFIPTAAWAPSATHTHTRTHTHTHTHNPREGANAGPGASSKPTAALRVQVHASSTTTPDPAPNITTARAGVQTDQRKYSKAKKYGIPETAAMRVWVAADGGSHSTAAAATLATPWPAPLAQHQQPCALRGWVMVSLHRRPRSRQGARGSVEHLPRIVTKIVEKV